MSKMLKILKSNDLENQERHIEKIKKEITRQTANLQINLAILEKLRSRSQEEITC